MIQYSRIFDEFLMTYSLPSNGIYDEYHYNQMRNTFINLTSSEQEAFSKVMMALPYYIYLNSYYWNLFKIGYKKNKKCEKCGSTRSLCIHHKEYWIRGKELLNDLNDRFLAIYCIDCHNKMHNNTSIQEIYSIYAYGNKDGNKCGYSAVIDKDIIITGCCNNSTINIMTLAAIYESLKHIINNMHKSVNPIKIELFSNSTYVMGMVCKDHISSKHSKLIDEIVMFIKKNRIIIKDKHIKMNRIYVDNRSLDDIARDSILSSFNITDRYNKNKV